MTDNAQQLAATADELNTATLADFKGWTFENLWIVPNVDEAGCKSCGAIHPYWTKNCVPTIFPDQFVFDGHDKPFEHAIKADPSDPLEGFVKLGTDEPAPHQKSDLEWPDA